MYWNNVTANQPLYPAKKKMVPFLNSLILTLLLAVLLPTIGIADPFEAAKQLATKDEPPGNNEYHKRAVYDDDYILAIDYYPLSDTVKVRASKPSLNYEEVYVCYRLPSADLKWDIKTGRYVTIPNTQESYSRESWAIHCYGKPQNDPCRFNVEYLEKEVAFFMVNKLVEKIEPLLRWKNVDEAIEWFNQERKKLNERPK